MGYSVTLQESSAVLPRENQDEAYARLCELNTHDEWKRGGSWKEGKQEEVWFSWMPADYPNEMKTVKEILEYIGYSTDVTEDNDLHILEYDSKTGCEDIFIWYISDLFRKSYMEWETEDGLRYVWTFGDGKKLEVSEQEPPVFGPALPFVPTNYNKMRELIRGSIPL